MDKHDEADSRFSQFCEHSKNCLILSDAIGNLHWKMWKFPETLYELDSLFASNKNQ